jgi:hypothetical protein
MLLFVCFGSNAGKIETLIRRDLPSGTSQEDALAYFDKHKIEHSKSVPPGPKGMNAQVRIRCPDDRCEYQHRGENSIDPHCRVRAVGGQNVCPMFADCGSYPNSSCLARSDKCGSKYFVASI